MSQWKERARAVRNEGTAQRRDWSPRADSWHWRVYQYWKRSGGKAPMRENFCHFWRVVLIWAPLMVVRNTLKSDKFWKGVFIALALLALCAFIFVAIMKPGQVLACVGIIAGIAWIICGLAFAFSLIDKITEDSISIEMYEWLEDKNYGVYALLSLLFLPVLIFVAVLALVLFAVGGVIVAPFQHYKIHKRIASWHVGSYTWLNPFTVLAAAVALGFVYFALHGNQFSIGLVAITLAFVLLIGLVMLLSWLADVYKRYRKVKREEQYQVLARQGVDFFIRFRFEVQHPEWIGDETKFAAWRVRYERYFNQRFGNMYDNYNVSLHVRYVSDELYKRYPWLFDYTSSPQAVPRVIKAHASAQNATPSKFDNFIEFCSFIWSVVLTRKWRICPLIDEPVATH